MTDIRRSRTIPDDKRDLFKEPLGTLIDENDLKKLDDKNKLITVGDVVSLTVCKNGIVPDIAVYDGMTERHEMTEFASFVKERGWPTDVVGNPAGMITAGLVNAVENALSGKTKRTIRVIGEEDLAVVPCILLSPEGTNVIYGMPGKGMMLITTDERIRKRTEELLEQTEEFK
ncbi:MAG: GTP-dependent dephospho-CoA kinase family protein [Methanomassiliicoccaceae archaeon]|nr:GTP-dependent dephospho-CoA kinase family protein [Methanomassiliicoccaceae archaeon]